jgi:type IV fimbrial biogenesis protein FimT
MNNLGYDVGARCGGKRRHPGNRKVNVQSPSSNLLSRNGRGLGRGIRKGGGTERFHQKGFTLIELMVVITVMVILLMMAVPSFQNATLGSKLASSINNLVASVNLARTEAFKRNAVVTVCASADATTCASTGGWEQGWIVRCPSDDTINCKTGGSGAIVFQQQAALASGFKVNQTLGGTSLSFQPIGVGTTQAALTFCRASPVGSQERVVTVSTTGETSVKRTTAGSCP